MKKGGLTLEHRAPVREQRGKGSATPADTAAVPGQTPGSPQPGAGPCGGQTVAELPQVGLPGSPAHPSPYSPRHWRRGGRAGAGREQGAPGGSPGRARGASGGGRAGAGTAGAGPARLGRNLGRKQHPDPLLAPPRFCGPGPRAVPLNLASPHAMPIQHWSAPLIPAAWGQPEEHWTPGSDTLDQPPCHLPLGCVPSPVERT